MRLRCLSRYFGLCAILLLGPLQIARAGEASAPPAAMLAQNTIPNPQFSLAFRGVTYTAAFQHNAGSDWFIEMTPPGQTVGTWRTLLVLHWLPVETGAPEDVTRRLAALAKKADARAHPQLSEDTRGQEAVVSFQAFSKAHGGNEGSVFKYGRTVAGNGLVAVQYSVRFAASANRAAVDREINRAFGAIKLFDLGQIELTHGRWGEPPPDRSVAVKTSAGSSAF